MVFWFGGLILFIVIVVWVLCVVIVVVFGREIFFIGVVIRW